MKRICIDGRMATHSGIGTYIRNIIQRLKDAPFALHLLTSRAAIAKIPWLEKFDLTLCDAPIYSLREQIEMPLKVPSCDLFWTPHFNAPLLPVRASKRLVTIHDLYHFAFFNELGWTQQAYAKVVIPHAAKAAAHVITNSRFTSNQIERYLAIDPCKITPIYLGVDQTRFLAGDEARHNSILFVGNVKPHKNLRRLLLAFRQLLVEGVECEMLIVGRRHGFIRGDDLSDLLVDPEIAPRLRCLGFVAEDELIGLYQRAAVTILPSLYEGFGFPALEAMSCGSPVVVSKVASLPEVCGEAAGYIDPHDTVDIARALRRVLEDKSYRDELKQRGFEWSRQFTWEKTAKEHIEVICRQL